MPVEKVLMEFKQDHQIAPFDIDTNTFKGKRLRAELLVHLKDRSGLKYSEIIKFPMFENLKYSSLGRIYKLAGEKLSKQK